MSEEKGFGTAIIGFINSLINFIVIVVIMLLVAFSAYAIWDSNQVYKAADSVQYSVYKPSEDNGLSFTELQRVNPEVFGWLTVYGTKIDYPITQGEDNMKYVNTNAEGNYSLSGAIFLDNLNDKNFNDFNSIIYGHHMEKQAMFGDLGEFGNKTFFEEHVYGNLYYMGKDHGLEFFAFIKTDAYDNSIFSTALQGEDIQQKYLENIVAKAKFVRNIGVSIEDNIVLLTTCSTDSTNGRDILVAKISDNVFQDAFKTENKNDSVNQITIDKQQSFLKRIPRWIYVALLIIIILLSVVIYIFRNNKKYKGARKL